MGSLDRRSFLTGSLAALSGAALAPNWLAAASRSLPAGARRLVVLELFGGNDGLNTLVPFEDELYYKARPLLALKRQQVLPIDDLNGLHPSLVRTRARYDEGRVAIVRDVGYPGPNLSHFASRDVWSCASTEALPSASGWLGRSAEAGELAELGLLSIGSDVAARLVRGKQTTPCAVPDLGSFRFDTLGALHPREARARLAAFGLLGASNDGQGETAFVAQGLRQARRASELLARAPRSQRPVDYPGGTLGRDLAAVADVIASDLPARLFHVQLKDFDTHTKQHARHAQLLGELDLALDAFLNDLRAQGRLDDTLVLVISEFGRRVAESGVSTEAGTDHGAASLTLLLGSGVRGGLHGGQPDLERLDEAGNLIQRVDFRSVLQSALVDWLQLDARSVLGATWPRLELVKPA
jgi:uncharacterized protein (DUF1501 family)